MPLLVRIVSALLGLSLAGCRPAPPAAPPVAPAPPSGGRCTVKQAHGFRVEYRPEGKLVEVLRPTSGAERPLRYLLVPRGAPAPVDLRVDAVIETPVERFAALSSTYYAALEQLGQLDRLVAVDQAQYVTSPAILERLADGRVTEVGAGNTLNIEALLALRPDLVMLYVLAADGRDRRQQLADYGLPAVVSGDYLENTPLGRAEWVKFVALFVGAEATAETWFDGVESRYLALREKVRAAAGQPTVLTGWDDQGTWYTPGGQSWLAHAIADAGGRYLWADDPSEFTLPLDFETVFSRGGQADIWLNPGVETTTLAQLRAADERYISFRAFQTGRVYNGNKQLRPSGANAFWERGVIEPDQVLADLVSLFHPELLPDHETVYFQPLRGDAP